VLHDVIGDLNPFCSERVIVLVNGEENPFSAIGDAAYRRGARGAPSHGHRKIW